MGIKEKRERIDEIDKKIIDLFEKRVKKAAEIIQLKKDQGKGKYDPNRETQIKNNLSEYSSLPNSFIKNVYNKILEEVKRVVK